MDELNQPVIPIVTEQRVREALRREWINQIAPGEFPSGMGRVLTFVPSERANYFEPNPPRQ